MYGKVKNVIGFGVLEDEDEENASGFGTGWREGRALIERGLQNSDVRVGLSATTGDRPYSDDRSSPEGGLQYGRNTYASPAASRSTIRPRAAEEQSEDEGGRYFFQDLGLRVKNTIDTVDRPQWLNNIKKPRWMNGGDQAGSGGSVVGRIFGGNAGGGGLRL